MTNHDHGDLSIKLKNTEGETNLANEWQGDFRKSMLDLDLLNYALQQDRKGARNVQSEYLVITCLDQMVEWKFTENGTTFTFKDEHEFVENVVQALHFKGMVYLSRSKNSVLEYPTFFYGSIITVNFKNFTFVSNDTILD